MSESCVLSEISRVEVLGYHRLKKEEEKYFKDVFDYASVIMPDRNIFDQAIEIRKEFNLKLGDSLIAATAMAYKLGVYTRNLEDFEKIKGLKCINPIKKS